MQQSKVNIINHTTNNWWEWPKATRKDTMYLNPVKK